MRMVAVSTDTSGPQGPASLVEDALQEAAAAIGAARTLLGQGHFVDLKGLETHVDRACGAIAKLPAAERNRMKPALVALIDGLNGLTEEITEQHKEVSTTLQKIGTRRQAVSAYRPTGKP